MIPSIKLFTFGKKISFNQSINLIFDASSFSNNIIIYDFFIKKLYSKMKIDINKLINLYLKIISKNNINKEVNPAAIYINMNLILKNFNDYNKDIKIKKLKELFEYMIVNHHYFSESKFIRDSLKRKIVRILIFSEKDEFDYYLFLLVNVKKIELITHNIKIDSFEIDSIDNDEIDFMLDNLDSQDFKHHIDDHNMDFLVIK